MIATHVISPAPTIADLPVLRRAVVTAVTPMDAHGRRLVSLGFAPGTLVTFARRAPFGGPLVVDLRGTQICLRVADARWIQVRAAASPRGEPQPEAPTPGDETRP